MKIRIEIDSELTENEVVIKCKTLDGDINRLHKVITDVTEKMSGLSRLIYYKDGKEFFFPADDVLFFETNDEAVYAHTVSDAFRIKLRLHELEGILPRDFVRISKSTIVNIKHIYSINRNPASSSLIQFQGSHKQVYVSRLYYKDLKSKMNEK